jgi:hypothetical protein
VLPSSSSSANSRPANTTPAVLLGTTTYCAYLYTKHASYAHVVQRSALALLRCAQMCHVSNSSEKPTAGFGIAG